jgi:hypothetical protein
MAGVPPASPPEARSNSAFEAEEETPALGVGASGIADSAFSRGSEVDVDFVSAEAEGGTVGVRGASAEIAVQQNSKSVVRIKAHLSHCRPRGGCQGNCNFLHFTVPPDRCHWPIGHGSASTFPSLLDTSGSGSFVLTPFRASPPFSAGTAIIQPDSYFSDWQRQNARFRFRFGETCTSATARF